jgi:phage shock protein C
MTETPAYRPLYRSSRDKKIAGICAGFGHYLNADPVAIRVLFVFLTVLTGGGALIAYVLAWILMPEEPVAASGWPAATAGAPPAA